MDIKQNSLPPLATWLSRVFRGEVAGEWNWAMLLDEDDAYLHRWATGKTLPPSYRLRRLFDFVRHTDVPPEELQNLQVLAEMNLEKAIGEELFSKHKHEFKEHERNLGQYVNWRVDMIREYARLALCDAGILEREGQD